MSSKREEVMNICKTLAEQENLKVCVTESLKGAAIVGASTFIGSLIGGRKGLLLGGVLGSLGAVIFCRGNYKSVVEILAELSDEQKQKLTDSVSEIIQDIQVQDVAALGTIALGSRTAKEAVIREVATFLKNEMGLTMQNYNN